MAKISKIQNSDRYIFECPACGCCHFINDTWKFNQDYDKPTIHPSIFVNRGQSNPESPACHFFIFEGSIVYLSDCTHEFAGQTIEMIDL